MRRWIGTTLVFTISVFFIYKTHSLNNHLNKNKSISKIINEKKYDAIKVSETANKQICQLFNLKYPNNNELKKTVLSFFRKVNKARGGTIITYTNNFFAVSLNWYDNKLKKWQIIFFYFNYDIEKQEYTLQNIELPEEIGECIKLYN